MEKKKIIILGAGTAGTIIANKLSKELNSNFWEITILDKEQKHYYQPGFLFLPFDRYTPEQIVKKIDSFIPKNVNLLTEDVHQIVPTDNKILLSNSTVLQYDILVVATGSQIAPQEIQGMKGTEWYKSIFDFYTFEGALQLRNKLRTWEGGKLVVHICEMPIKCPVAPLEFAFLADEFFRNKKMRDKVEITYVTPMSGAFTKPVAAKELKYLLDSKNIKIVADFNIEKVDTDKHQIVDYGDRTVDYNLLVTVPTNMGDDLIFRSDMGDDLNFVPTDKNTLQSKIKENIFVIGDATDIPASKAGAVAHFEADIVTDNILKFIEGKPLKHDFDGHSNCFIETGNGKALLIDFNYDQEPVKGTFPIPGIGPLRLLKENRMNHWGKLAFRWIYWNILIKGRPIPFVTSKMKKAGKQINQ